MIGILIGSIAWVVFATVGFTTTARLYPYPVHSDALTMKLIWVQRLVFEKMLNLGIITLTGIGVAFFANRKPKNALIGAASAALAYQSLGIWYVIIRWGFTYYKSSNNFFGTLYTSLAFCAGSAFLSSSFLRWRKRKTDPGAFSGSPPL